ncbi:hypothetical protein PVAND_005738 [Polypedilum vanderplanki]|uniref:BZIP domain-containing protein n=1 Tax=Polypedilum vanderplanki TaxID=319348 RepID=A0A9J6C2Y3_POLVA|nr:hypothetical protein PVAND_005738 [Polypedilum vanderplanki]
MNNYSEQMKNIYHNIMIHHHQQLAYAANMMVALSTPKSEPLPATSIIKIEPGLTPQMSPEIQNIGSPSSHATSTSFSLDTEIPREEIEGDIEVIMVRHFQDNLKTLDTTLNGLRGKKFGFRELLELSQSRPTYYPTSTIKRDRTTSCSSSDACTSLNTTTENDQNAKKPKMDNTTNNNADDSFCSDDGRLMIDWNDPEQTEEKIEQPKVHIKKEKDDVNVIRTTHKKVENEYKPSHIRFERLKHMMNKKKPRFNVDNLNLTYHSNMARNFPGTENRTEEQQERRNKNTLAARISRNKNKIYEQVLEKQSMNAMIENINLKRQVSMLRVYANSLMKLSGFADADFCKMWEENIKEMLFDTSE